MNSTLRFLTWAERAEHYDRLAEIYRENGNTRDAEYAEVNAKTMRMCEAEGVSIHG